jgi:hypothetical protein
MVELETPVGTQRRWITGGGSYQSVDQPDAFFGLGDATAGATVTLRVRWPGGAASEIRGVPVGRLVVLGGTARAAE